MIVFAADLHLTPHIWQDMSSLAGDAYNAFKQLVDYCVTNEASALVLGGDIFDKPKPDSMSVATFIDGMTILAQAQVPVFAIQGQHEQADPPWACLSEHVQCIGDGQLVTIDDGGVAVTLRGFDNGPIETMQQATKKLDPVSDILVVHQLAKQLVPFEGAWNFDADWAPKGVKLSLGGDYHIRSNAGRMHYPGSTHMRNISEIGDHFILTVTPEFKTVQKGRGKKKTEERELTGFAVEPVKLKTRKVVQLCMSSPDARDQLLPVITPIKPVDGEAVDDTLPPLVYLLYDPQVEDALSRVAAVCKEQGYFLRTRTLSGGTEVVEGVPQLGSVTLEECLAGVVDRNKEPDFFNFVLSLLTSDVRATLDALKMKFKLIEEKS